MEALKAPEAVDGVRYVMVFIHSQGCKKSLMAIEVVSFD
jgi:hypothetical protein